MKKEKTNTALLMEWTSQTAVHALVSVLQTNSALDSSVSRCRLCPAGHAASASRSARALCLPPTRFRCRPIHVRFARMRRQPRKQHQFGRRVQERWRISEAIERERYMSLGVGERDLAYLQAYLRRRFLRRFHRENARRRIGGTELSEHGEQGFHGDESGVCGDLILEADSSIMRPLKVTQQSSKC
jgi:hypothetical protein